MLSLLTQTPKYNIYKRVSLESQQRKNEISKKMRKRKTVKRHKKINIQVVQNTFLNEKLKQALEFDKLKTPEKKDMVVIMSYNEFQELVDIAQRRKRSKTALKKKVTFLKMAKQASSFKLPHINREQTVPVERGRTKSVLQTQQTESVQLNLKRKVNKRLNKVKTQISNYTQQVGDELSKQKFDDFLASVKRKVMETSFHIQNSKA